jgi:hypothetical protein
MKESLFSSKVPPKGPCAAGRQVGQLRIRMVKSLLFSYLPIYSPVLETAFSVTSDPSRM